MGREEKGRERKGVKQEFMGIKLKRGILIAKRGGNCTPSPTWRLGFAQPDGSLAQDLNLPATTTVSARKLGANLWEVQPHLKVLKMSKGGTRPRHHNHHHKDKGFEFPTQLVEPPDSSPEQPASATSLRRHVAASLHQHHRSVERNGHVLQPVSPASYSSSMEVTPYNPAATPTGSLDFKGRIGESRIGESSYSLKTSTELLKVLNRIWCLEEKHASNISLVNVLKRELDHSRTRIKELMQEKRADQQEMDDMMKQIAEDKVVRKNKEHERIKAAVQSVRDELEDERKLRKHSESLHRKLARDFAEIQSSFSNALKELEKERKARILLEDLCDEFAKEIRDYEQEVRFLKHKPEKDRVIRENPDRLILHISEAWLDERMQMKQAEARCDLAEKNTIVDKLCFEIETFLRAKQLVGSRNNDDEPSLKKPKENGLRRHSLESFHLNEAASAPQNGDEEDSIGSGSHCFELNRGSSGKQSNGFSKHGENAPESHLEEIVKSNHMKKKVRSRELIKGHDLSSLQIQFKEQIAVAAACNGSKNHMVGKQEKMGVEHPAEVNYSQKLEISEVTQEGLQERKNKRAGNLELNSNHVLDNLTRNHSTSFESGKHHQENKSMEDPHEWSAFTGLASPVPQWMSRLAAPDPDVSESSSLKLPRGIKENTLKAKLLEARLEGQQSRSKTSKGTS